MNMKKTFALWLLAAGLVAGIATVGYAQNTTTTPYGNSAPATERGPGADQYALHGPSLQRWEFKSDSVNLRAFLDTEVRLTVVKSTQNDGTLTVTDLILVSLSCASR